MKSTAATGAVLAAALLSLLGHSALAFSGLVVDTTRASTRPYYRRASQLFLFGGANKGGADNASKEPGMMERLQMIQKAQQMAQKKKKIDDDLAKETFTGASADGKVSITIKFIPPTNPMDPSPDYAATAVNVDDNYFAATPAADLGVAFKQAYLNGIENTNQAIAVQYKVLQDDMLATMQGMKKQ